MMNYENWKEFFLGENEVQSTEDQEEIRNFLNGEPGTPISKWAKAQMEPQSMFMMKVEGEASPVFIHQLTIVQGNRKELIGGSCHIALSGLERNAATLIIQPEKAFENIQLPTRNINKIFKASSAQELTEIQPRQSIQSETNPCIFVPAQIATEIIELEGASAIEMALLAKEIVFKLMSEDEEMIDEEIENETEGNENGNEAAAVDQQTVRVVDNLTQLRQAEFDKNGGRVIQWLLNFSQNLLKSVPVRPPISGRLIQDVVSKIELCRLGPINRPPPQATGSMDRAAMAEHLEILGGFVKGATDKLIDTTGSTKVQDSMLSNQLKWASSIDGINQGEMTNVMKEVLRTKDKTGKKLIFKQALTNKGYDGIFLCHSQIESITQGPLEHPENQPGGVSFFLMHVPGTDITEAEENAWMIVNKQNLGLNRTISESEFKKFTEKVIKVPATIDEALEVMRQQHAIFTILFGVEAQICDHYDMFIRKLESIEVKMKIKNKIKLSDEYLPTLLHYINACWNTFFQECNRAPPESDEVNFENLDLCDQLLPKIKMDQLSIDVMPPYLRKMEKKETPTEKRGGGGLGTGNESKRQKKVVKNEKPNATWSIKEGEDFEKMFFSKDGSEKPNGVCLKFWINNECIKSCSKAKSHFVLTAEQRKDMDKFVKQCRKCE